MMAWRTTVWHQVILDFGCRECVLRKYELANYVTYGSSRMSLL